MINEEVKRFVIRREDGLYYNGNQTFRSGNFDKFEKAKVFKNVSGAKNACLNLELHHKWWVKNQGEKPHEYEIVEIITMITDNVIKYENQYGGAE